MLVSSRSDSIYLVWSPRCLLLSAPDLRHHVQLDLDWPRDAQRGRVLRVAMRRRMRTLALVYSVQHGNRGLKELPMHYSGHDRES